MMKLEETNVIHTYSEANAKGEKTKPLLHKGIWLFRYINVLRSIRGGELK